MKKIIYLACCCLFFQMSFAQKATDTSVVTMTPDGTLNHSVLDKAPLLKGCEANINTSQCTDDKINDIATKKLMNDASFVSIIKKEKIKKVYVRFIVTERGSVENIGVRTQNSQVQASIQKALRTLPNFSPGQHKGRTVKTAYSLFLDFSEVSVAKSSQTKL